MAHTNVSNSVLSIIASFANGLDVLKRLRAAAHKNGNRRPKSNNKKNASNALQLSQSLRRGADEIGREYQARSVRCDSERYAVGDATAQTSLAEILLKFNTGLVGIITSFLHRDSPSRMDLDYQSLTNLSEHSRSQSIAVLRQLYQRIVSRRAPRNLNPASANSKTRPKKPEGRDAASPKLPRTRHPRLARVVIENSSIPSQIALVRPAESKKPRPSRTQSSERVETPSGSGLALPSETSFVPQPPPPYFPSEPLPSQSLGEDKRPRHHRSRASFNKTSSSRQLRQKHSVPFASSRPPPSSIDPVAQPPGQPSSDPIFESPVKPALQRPRPHTLYSIASARTASTKLGEIPMDKWPVPWDFAAAEEANRLALEGGWPIVAGGGEGGRKKGSGGWRRWFGRKGGGVC